MAQKSYMPQGLNARYLIYHVTAYVTNTREFHPNLRLKTPLLLNLDKKRTHQAFLLGEFMAKGVNCDTRDGYKVKWVHSHSIIRFQHSV